MVNWFPTFVHTHFTERERRRKNRYTCWVAEAEQQATRMYVTSIDFSAFTGVIRTYSYASSAHLLVRRWGAYQPQSVSGGFASTHPGRAWNIICIHNLFVSFVDTTLPYADCWYVRGILYKGSVFVMDGLPPANEKSALTISNGKQHVCIQTTLEHKNDIDNW